MTKKTTKARTSGAITSSSTAEYFSKNLQQVGFSSPTKALLTTLKESVDNALDACEEHGILPEIRIEIEKLGNGTLKNTDLLRVLVCDNGPGIEAEDVPKVFGEYLASSKFGRGRCSRGQQGIGISAATTWAQHTTARGAQIITKTAKMKKALKCLVDVDIKHNKGLLKNKEMIDWDRPHGTSVDFHLDGRVQLNGEGGILGYIKGTILLNPHLSLTYVLPDCPEEKIDRVTNDCPEIPDAIAPHPHTMKLGEFVTHAKLFGTKSLATWLKTGFSCVGESVLSGLVEKKLLSSSLLEKRIDGFSDDQFKQIFSILQQAELRNPPTSSVITIGEESLARSIKRLGEIDFFAVVSRKPTICDFKPVQIEVAIARLLERSYDPEEPSQILRFANRVPLQFDKASCAIVKSIVTVNWKTYGIKQPRQSLPLGPYIIAVSVVSPFIKFKNASKETIDGSDELVEEIRRALMQAGMKLSRHIRREFKASELENRIQHIEQFAPILVEGLCRILRADEKRKKAAELGLLKILGRDAKVAHVELNEANENLDKQKIKEQKNSSAKNEVDENDDEQNVMEQKTKDKNAIVENVDKKKIKGQKTSSKKKAS